MQTISSCHKIKIDFAREIRLYYTHARLIITRSKRQRYLSDETQMALNKGRDLYLMALKPENNSMREMCKFTLVIEKKLWQLLPVQTNNSYDSSLKRLKLIIHTATIFLYPLPTSNEKIYIS